MLSIEKRNLFMLAHPRGIDTYTFIPQDDGTVEVMHHTRWSRTPYILSVEESRGLWQRLRLKNYEKF